MSEQFTSSKTGVDLAKHIRKQAKKIKANGCISGDMFFNSAAKLATEFEEQAKHIAELKAERDALRCQADCPYTHMLGVACNKCGWAGQRTSNP